MTAPRVFTPEQVAEMRERLAELTAEFLRESDPQSLVGVQGADLHKLLRDRKQRTGYLLAAIGDLQRILERIPVAPGAAAAGDDSTAERVAEAKRLGAQLRERAKGMQ
jgi:hypothetical protein